MRRPEGVDACIVNEDIDVPVSEIDCSLPHLAYRCCVSKVGGYEICFAACRANLVDRLLTAFRISAHNQDMNTKLSQFHRSGKTDSAGPSRNERYRIALCHV